MINGIAQDFRYAVRQLHKYPTFSIVAIVTLALAVGANTAIFSVVRAVLVNSAPYPEVDRLAMIWGSNPSRGDKQFPISAGDFTDWKQKNDVFEDIASSYDDEMTLTGSGEPRMTLGYAFSPNYFHILGVAPAMGRTFTDEEANSRATVAVISDKFWHTTLHGDASVLGKPLTLDGKPYVVIGVMPPRFDYPPQTELWIPLALDSPQDYEHRFVRVIGRLKRGVSLAQAQLRMNVMESQIAALHPATDAGEQTSIEPLRQQISGDIQKPLLALWAAVGIVLIIACANIGGLLLARAAGRRSEISLRVAIGATSARLVRQFLCESLVMALFGGVLGIGLALFGTRFLLSIFPNGIANLSIPKIEAIPIDGPVLWFSLAITLLTGLLFGAIPALQSAHTDGSDAIKEFRSMTSSLHSTRLRRLLVTVEIALCLVLLAGAGWMIQSFANVSHEQLGFRPDPLLALEVFLPPSGYPESQPAKRSNFVAGVLDGLNKLPGVESATATNFLPLSGFWGTTDFAIEGHPAPNKDQQPLADNRLVTPNYFSTMGISLLRGRAFTDFDKQGSEQVAIINASLARHYFGSDDPLNKVVQLSDSGHVERWQIVGVVSDVKAFGPEEPAHADLYRPLAQVPFPLLAFVVRTNGDPATLLKSAQNAVWDVDKNQPIFDSMPMRTLAAQSMTLRRTSSILLANFAILALIVAIVGLYGLVAYNVMQRTHEMGIRIAVGAHRRDILALVMRQGMLVVLLGEIIGLAITLLARHFLSSVLYGVSLTDQWALLVSALVMMLVSLLASYIPARRATRVDPMIALRTQ
jgi:putative ABC transport system permease protein